MPKYSQERKDSVLKKLLPPNSYSVAALSKIEGISPQTLYHWRHQATAAGVFVPNDPSSQQWDKHTRFSVVLETASMNAEELSAYCREKGIYPSQVESWKQACINGVEEPVVDSKVARSQVKELKQSKKKLERELKRKDKALAEAAALLVLQKKYQALWEDEAS